MSPCASAKSTSSARVSNQSLSPTKPAGIAATRSRPDARFGSYPAAPALSALHAELGAGCRRSDGSASCIAQRCPLRDRWDVKLRSLLVDDSRTFIASARRLLESQDMEIVGTATSGAEALELAAALSPDLALVDVELGEEDGIALAEELRSRSPATRVVLISTYGSDDMRDVISTSSAVGFLPKSRLSGDAVRDLLNGDQREAR
jgi:CheY-like chemotaxis protein